MKRLFYFGLLLRLLWKWISWPFKKPVIQYSWIDAVDINIDDVVGHRGELLKRGQTQQAGKVVYISGDTITVEVAKSGNRKKFNRNHLLKLVKITS